MEEVEWRFGVVGNIVSEHTDENGNVYYGSKAFTSGTKVYIHGKFGDSENPNIAVIGRNRFGRTVFEAVPINLIENIRVKRIYKPSILAIIDSLCVAEGLEWWERTAADRKHAENFAKELSEKSKMSYYYNTKSRKGKN